MIKNSKFEWLQALRALGAIAVLLFHMTPHFEASAPLAFLAKVTRWGFCGVDIFFVLSGFVVYRSACQEIPLIGKVGFLVKRSLRIYAGYWVALIFFFCIDLLVLHNAEPSASKLIRSVFLLYPNTFDNALPVAWSLTYELYFYGLVAALFLIDATRRMKIACLGMLLVLLSNGIAFLLNKDDVLLGNIRMPFAITPLSIEFFAGLIMGAVYGKLQSILAITFESLSIGILLVFLGFSVGMVSPFFDRVDIIRVGSYGLMSAGFLVTFLTLHGSNHTPPRWLTLMGDASYSLYLIHVPLLDLSGRWRYALFSSGSVNLSVWCTAMTPFVVIALSLLWYRFIEKPIQIRVYRQISKRFGTEKNR